MVFSRRAGLLFRAEKGVVMKSVRNDTEDLQIMRAQHWDESVQELDSMTEGLTLEFARLYLQNMQRAMIDSTAVVTDEEARAFLENIERNVKFERTMIDFMKTIAQQNPSECREVILNPEHLWWIRKKHQQYQLLKMYTGAKKLPGGKKATPKLYGIPIVIDESVAEPRFW